MFNFLFIKFSLSFCSLSYELLLAQTLSTFLSDTVLRYSTTIGLYMFCMGLGAFTVSDKRFDKPFSALWATEMALAVIGAVGVPVLFIFDWLQFSAFTFTLAAYGLIAAIGFLTGLELPLMFRMLENKDVKRRNLLLTADYTGALFGTICFVFFFYPSAGILQAAWQVAAVNVFAAFLLTRGFAVHFAKDKGIRRCLEIFMFVGLIVCLIFGSRLEGLFINLYTH